MAQAPILGFGCVICSDTFDVNVPRNICTIPQCGHVYHEYCVKRWFRTQIRQGIPSNCPKCRIPAMESQVIRLFLHETISSDNDAEEEADEDEPNDNDDDSLIAESDDDFEELVFNEVGSQLQMPRLVPIQAQMNNNPTHDMNEREQTSFDDDTNGAAPFNQWVPTPSFSWAYSLNTLDQRLLLLDTDVAAMSDIANRLETYLQAFH